MPFPGPSSSGDQVLGEHSHPQVDGSSYCLPPVPAAQFSGCTRGRAFSGVLCVSSEELISGCNPPGIPPPAPACLSPVGDGPVRSLLALPWYLLSLLFCEQAWQCLRLGLFYRIALSLPLSLSLSLAIPQSGLLSDVSSLRLPSGHSGPVLTLSSVARASLFSPCLLVVATSAGSCH